MLGSGFFVVKKAPAKIFAGVCIDEALLRLYVDHRVLLR